MADGVLRRPFVLVGIYAAACGIWLAFAHAIAGAHDIIDALLLATILYLGVLWYVARIRLRETLRREQAAGTIRLDNILIAYSALFLAVAVFSGLQGDYPKYLIEWTDVLDGRDPWQIGRMAPGIPFNAYGPVFNALAPLVWINPLANKLLFAFAYLVFLIWLVRDFGERQAAGFSWPMTAFWLLNPFPWIEIAGLGFFDVLVGIACVLAIHWRLQNRDHLSAAALAGGTLLKFMPVVLLPFLLFNGRRFRSGLFACYALLVAAGVAVSVLIWDLSTFTPLTFAATRPSQESVYYFLGRFMLVVGGTHNPSQDPPDFDWLAAPCLLAAGTAIFAWCKVRRVRLALAGVLAIASTLAFYRINYPQYQMVLFCVASYWMVSEWETLNKHRWFMGFVFGYFSLLGLYEVGTWSYILVGRAFFAVMLLKCVMGLALLAAFIAASLRNSVSRMPEADSKPTSLLRYGWTSSVNQSVGNS